MGPARSIICIALPLFPVLLLSCCARMGCVQRVQTNVWNLKTVLLGIVGARTGRVQVVEQSVRVKYSVLLTFPCAVLVITVAKNRKKRVVVKAKVVA